MFYRFRKREIRCSPLKVGLILANMDPKSYNARMIERFVSTALNSALARQAAVTLLGPRQVGKTTLALRLASERPSIYLDLQRMEDRTRLSDPSAFLERYEDRLVVLDEIHRVPELFAELRGIIDRGRARGQRHGRFLLLGSASIDLLRQSSETLAGRIAFIELTPFLALELSSEKEQIEELWLRGGFPESYLAVDPATSFLNRQDFIQTYLHRDIREFAPRIATDALERLWLMLAHCHSGIVRASSLASSLGVNASTVANYIDLLADLFLVRRLRPYHANLKKRLVKSPKIYIRDSGILHALLGLRDYFALSGSPSLGPSWEGFVIENILAVTGERIASFYRTSSGAEIDLVLQFPRDGLIAIEIKAGQSFKLERGFHEARSDLQPQKSFVVYGGQERYPLKDGIEAIGLAELCAYVSTLR